MQKAKTNPGQHEQARQEVQMPRMQAEEHVTKCVGGFAELCNTCWRRVAPIKNKFFQTYFDPIPLYDGEKCEEYWKIKP